MKGVAEHRHSDLSDPVVLHASVLFALLRYWGQSFFVLLVTLIPAGFALHAVLRAVAPASWVVAHFIDWFINGWLALSLPLSVLLTYLRSRRVRENRLVIDPAGLEYRWFPRRPVRVAWSDVESIRDTYIPGRRQARSYLILQTRHGRIELCSDDWDLRAIEADLKRYFEITRATAVQS